MEDAAESQKRVFWLTAVAEKATDRASGTLFYHSSFTNSSYAFTIS
nr:hypothetical protein [Agrobacterium fabrum]